MIPTRPKSSEEPRAYNRLEFLALRIKQGLKSEALPIEPDKRRGLVDDLENQLRLGNYNYAVTVALREMGLTSKELQIIGDTYTPPGLYSKVESSRILGFNEYRDPDLLKGKPLGGFNVQSITTPSGEWARKPTLIDGRTCFDNNLEIVRSDLLMRELIQRYLPRIIVPDAFAHVSDNYIIKVWSKIVESEEIKPLNDSEEAKRKAEEEAQSLCKNYMEDLSLASFLFGVRDLRKVNIRWKNEQPVLVDFGMLVTEPYIYPVAKAKTLIESGETPFVDPAGGNRLEPYLARLEQWKRESYKPAEIRSMMHDLGFDTASIDKYLKTLSKNIDSSYETNMKTFIALANGTLPEDFLSKLGWRGNKTPGTNITFPSPIPEELAEDKDLVAKLLIDQRKEIDFPKHGQILLEVGSSNFVILEKLPDKAGFKITFIKGSGKEELEEVIINKDNFVIGSKTGDLLIENQSVARKGHVQVEFKNNRVLLTPLDIDYTTKIWS